MWWMLQGYILFMTSWAVKIKKKKELLLLTFLNDKYIDTGLFVVKTINIVVTYICKTKRSTIFICCLCSPSLNTN